MSTPSEKITKLGTGQGYTDHPLHPATVHFPIAFLTTAFALDTIHLLGRPGKTGNLIFERLLPPQPLFSTLAFYSGCAGILFSIPSILTGASELNSLIQMQIKYKKSLKKIASDAWNRADLSGEKTLWTVIHAAMNDVIVGITVWNYYSRRNDSSFHLPYANTVVSAICLPLLFYSAYLGGDLVYRLGFGVSRNSSFKKE